MGLLPKPHATLTDADVAEALCRAVAVIDPLLDLLADADPVGLRRRTHRLLPPPRRLSGRVRRWRLRRRRRAAGRGPGAGQRALDLGARLFNAADLPGTAAWARLDRDQRVHWWVYRVGALNTLVVASPGLFGWLTRMVPVAELAGFVNQAIVLCAVAREYGVTDRPTRVRLLAEVLCGRQLPADFDLRADFTPTPLPQNPPAGWRPLAAITASKPVVITRTVWQLVGILRATFDEAAKRPHPGRWYRRLATLPWIGAIATYFGERSALVRAARAGQDWLAAHGAAGPAGELPGGEAALGG